MCKKFKIYISEVFDPKINLAMEEWLMANNEHDEVIMFLWQNENTIVIGRNQNPFKECDIKKVKEDSVNLVRRLTGGGAVYHDLGNLNFTFITSEENYDIENNMEIILNGVSKFGIEGYFNGRNDLIVCDQKFSGNAFSSNNGTNCHHGTLLVDVNLDKLSRYLTVSPLKLKSKGIDSVLSRVINLKEINPQITIEGLKASLIESFNKFYKTQAPIVILGEKSVDIETYFKKYNSWEWNYSESPDFSIVVEEKFSWGIFEMNLELSNGIIKACKIYTDSIVLEAFNSLENALCAKYFKSDDILEVIAKYIEDEQIKKDICSLVKDKFITG